MAALAIALAGKGLGIFSKKLASRAATKAAARKAARTASKFRRATQTAIPEAAAETAEKAPGLLRRAGQSIRRNPKLSALGAVLAVDQTLKETTSLGIFEAAGIPLGFEDPRDIARIEAKQIKASKEAELGLAQREDRRSLFGPPETLLDSFDQQFGTFEERAARNAILAEHLIPNLIMNGADISALLASTGPQGSGVLAGLSAGEQARLAQASRTTGPQTPTKVPQDIDPAMAGAQALASI